MITILKYFFKLLFGKNYELIWRQFAKETGGVFINGAENKVEITYRNNVISVDNYTHYIVVGGSSYEKEYLRAKVDFKYVDRIDLRITPQDIFENVEKLFGAKDIEIGYKEFDKQFMIRGNDSYKIQTLLSNDTVRELIMELKPIRLAITEDEGIFDEKPVEGNSMIYFISKVKVKDTVVLKQLYDLIKTLIDSLVDIGSLDKRPTANSECPGKAGCRVVGSFRSAFYLR